ncbi:conserved hypothetical protein [Ignisphaera aggregans DSM 17230]|uniref:Antitoxin SocA-like Panacea domain-containing protein n=1 Tax=Ignisphaera aggregans (strain DSM 17230 / JCM 13409 / AQ1.S1) TaxID=583356 RepID=E0SRT8_IGNAA|nr:conserved hypothetical protein [Ignisphaera aggregans DSM 17230]
MADPRDIVLYTISRYAAIAGRGISRIRLMKLLFLADYIYKKRFNKKLTNAKWIMWLFGPFSKDILNVLDELEVKGKVIIEDVDGIGIFYSTYERVRLDDEVKNIIDEVIREYGVKSLEQLLQDVYSLREVKEAKIGDLIL